MNFEAIESVIAGLDIQTIDAERKRTLQPLVDYIQSQVKAGESVRLNFICTHNSRRSHLSQVWAQAMAEHFEINNVYCYSGGTEATAMYPMAAQTLSDQGFDVRTLAEGSNPIYAIKYAATAQPLIGFSKTWDDDFNPTSGFAAIMTCSSADQGCPFIAGADKRIPITFEDPKAFDGTPQQAEKYAERSLQIATEMYLVFSLIQK
ncbi:protein-tyrosine-phosphatase [Reichenbachiella sp. 5M10]|uniref:protein-tyrosine-phosphatase n=1 Tax=Reichenbachiella sp. 5M10 TaxID=1889772 RepID=UPI000C147949|nr:protein-tyrosine-phosphatase [Reichenbachiella sp. 5M10]PIB36983.1 protein-tyrosine-phosphatase [Reichenbachiella sp. 5M10]